LREDPASLRAILQTYATSMDDHAETLDDLLDRLVVGVAMSDGFVRLQSMRRARRDGWRVIAHGFAATGHARRAPQHGRPGRNSVRLTSLRLLKRFPTAKLVNDERVEKGPAPLPTLKPGRNAPVIRASGLMVLTQAVAAIPALCSRPLRSDRRSRRPHATMTGAEPVSHSDHDLGAIAARCHVHGMRSWRCGRCSRSDWRGLRECAGITDQREREDQRAGHRHP
jgi:hypothetical protein